MKRSPLQRRTALKTDPAKVQAFRDRGRRSSARTFTPRPISPASPAQRSKCRNRLCVNCASQGPCDPAHLVPRGLGGCDDLLCVIPLCRECHRAFDDGQLDLESVIALPQFSAERAHMASHMSLRACIHRLTGRRLIDDPDSPEAA